MLAELQNRIGYQFQDSKKLKLAMTHSSYANENVLGKQENNERLEFLGDAVLELVSSQFLFMRYPDKPEGDLTKKRASMVCEPTLALCAREIPLGKYLLLGKGEERTGGRMRDSIISDAMEALIGAIYLDGGFEAAKAFIEKFILNDIEKKELFFDSKTILQEAVQKQFPGKEIHYKLVREEGPAHNKTFVTQVLIGEQMFGEGIGRTKKGAEQEAAYQAILKLKA